MGSIKMGWTKVGKSDRSKSDRSKSERSKSERSKSERSKSDCSKNLNPDQRAQIEQSRKRFQCDLLGFWRQCRRTACRQGHRCTGDPFDCFRRRYAAMPRDHENWPRATLLSRATGIGTAEIALRAVGLSMPRRIRPEPGSLPPPHQADAAATAVVPVQESDASRWTRREAEILAKLSPERIGALEKSLGALGMTLQCEIPPEHEGLSPPREAVAAAPAVAVADIARPETDPPEVGMDAADAADTIEWSPMTGSSVDPVRAAPEPPPLPGPPPGVEPWQAWCDDEGRLHMPDPAAVKERFRMLTWDEIQQRMRAYGG